MILRFLKAAPKGAFETIRGLYPLLVCLIGSLFMSIGWDAEGASYWVTSILGAICFVWALDLAETKGRAKAATEYTDLFLSYARSSKDAGKGGSEQ